MKTESTKGPSIEELRNYIYQKYKLSSGWQSKFARECGVSPSMVSAVFLGKKKIPESMAKIIGWRRIWIKP